MIKPIFIPCFSPVPGVYDNSLSEYEAICKLTAKINDVVADINDNLETYIKDNFNNIMIQASYIENTETIKLAGTVTIENATHAYSDNSLIIKGDVISNV